MMRALINVPPKAKRGDVIEIKTLISHPMETGYRRDNMGQPIARDILHTFVCKYNNVEIFRADLHPAVSANPFLTFFTRATESGEFTMTWTADDGETHTETVKIAVE
jgi:sulfur-oxidizing protein SoxZ